MRRVMSVSADDTVTPSAPDHDWAETTLSWLLHYPLLRAADLAEFCQVSPSTMSRQLLMLRGLDRRGRPRGSGRHGSQKARAYVEEITPVGLVPRGSQSLYHLSDWGLAVVARGRGEDPASTGQRWGADESHLLRQLPRLERLVRAQAFVAGLLHGAGIFLGEHGYLAHGEWDWRRDYLHHFSVRQRERRLASDAAFVVRIRGVTRRTRSVGAADLDHATIDTRQAVPERWHAGFVVTGGAIQDWRAAARQLEGFFLYRESPDWWSLYPAFPPLLILVWDDRHAELWHALAARLLAHGYPPLPGALAVAQTGEVLSAGYDPWRAVWTELGTGRSIRLAQVLAPLPPEALPPGLAVRSLDHGYLDDQTVAGKDGDGHGESARSGARRVVVGNFQARATRIVAATSPPTTKSAGPNLQALRLLSLCLGGRHLRLLDTLFDTPGIRLKDLAELLDARPDSLARYLSELDHHGLLEWSRPSMSDVNTTIRRARRSIRVPNEKRQRQRRMRSYEALLGLSPRGLRLVSARYGLGPRLRYARRAAVMHPSGSYNQGPSARAAHTAGIYHFFALVARAARRTIERADPSADGPSTTRLLWWEVGSRSEYRYLDHGRWHNLRPDGAGAIRTGERRFHFWLEYDRGTMGQRDLVQKFMSYATYLSSGQWREALGRPVPHLLIVVQDLAQLARMQRAAAQVFGLTTTGSGLDDKRLAVPQFRASITLAQRLEDAGPFAAIWWPLFVDDPGPICDGSPTSGLVSRGKPRMVFPGA